MTALMDKIFEKKKKNEHYGKKSISLAFTNFTIALKKSFHSDTKIKIKLIKIKIT